MTENDPQLHRPTILQVDDAALEALRADPAITVLDTLDQQRTALREIVPALDPELLEESPRWVHYPWRRSLVALLGPRSFRRLRLDRNRNKITAAEQDRLGALRIGVVGLSVGHAIAHTIALEGLCGSIRLADFDELELSNLNRIPATVFDLGLNKAVLAARRIAELDPYLPVEVVPGGVIAATMPDFVAGLDLIVEECDSLDIKVRIRELARAAGIPVVMETSDRGLIDVERFDLEPDRPLFHGLLGDVRSSDLAGLSTQDKVPHVLRILEPGELSARMAASMVEVDETLTTWPQLGSDVTLGAATVATVIRRIGQDGSRSSGRGRVDLTATVEALEQPPQPRDLSLQEVAPAGPDVDPEQLNPLAAVVHAMSLAPSGGNAQPWRFVPGDGWIQVHLVPERSVTMDLDYRASYLAIGAGLFNARVAAARHGVGGPIEILPDPAAPQHIATVHLGSQADPELAELYEPMLARCANRQLGAPAPIEPQLRQLLDSAAAAEGATVRYLSAPEQIEECGRILGESDRLRFLTPRLHREMMSELRWPDRDELDLGLDVRTLELDAADLAKLTVAARSDVMAALGDWDVGTALGQDTRDRLASSSAVAVLTMSGATPADYLRAGAAVERFWIAAQRAGLGVQPVSPIFLYARDEADVATLVPERHRPGLTTLSRRFRSLLSMPDYEEFALILRLSHAPAPTVRSRRLSLASLMGDHAGA
ncbi:MAG TPA: Rv1355c family protein [Mycobacteriales bacterium]|nr:Rv1355c family protein [Mycobacteriales bacterium]